MGHLKLSRHFAAVSAQSVLTWGVYASMLGTCMRRPVLRSHVVCKGSTMGMFDTVTLGTCSTSDSAGVQK